MLNLASSTYYYKSKESARGGISLQEQEADKSITARRADLQNRIERIACEFPGYGYRRITAQLRREGYVVNHKKVLRIMRQSSLLCVVKRSYKRTTNSDHPYPRFPNLIKDLAISSLNQMWVADITYIRILTAFVYLAVVLDVFSRKVIGYALSRSLNAQFALNALKMAIAQRQPLPGCTHHSDQGLQYASMDYITELNKYKFQISMASRGDPYENATAESFIKTLKYEEVYLYDYRTLDDVIKRVPFFLQEVYNKKRLRSALGYIPPDEFELLLNEKKQTQLLSAITI